LAFYLPTVPKSLLLVRQVGEAHPRFLRRQLGEVVADALEDATRQLAAEFLITLCEARDKAPGMMRKLPTFAEQIFRIMLNFLLDIEVRPLASSLQMRPATL